MYLSDLRVNHLVEERLPADILDGNNSVSPKEHVLLIEEQLIATPNQSRSHPKLNEDDRGLVTKLPAAAVCEAELAQQQSDSSRSNGTFERPSLVTHPSSLASSRFSHRRGCCLPSLASHVARPRRPPRVVRPRRSPESSQSSLLPIALLSRRPASLSNHAQNQTPNASHARGSMVLPTAPPHTTTGKSKRSARRLRATTTWLRSSSRPSRRSPTSGRS